MHHYPHLIQLILELRLMDSLCNIHFSMMLSQTVIILMETTCLYAFLVTKFV